MTKAELQLIRSLDDKRSREEAGLFVAEGEKLVRELVASDFVIRAIYFTAGEIAGGQRVTSKEMERASRLKTPAGALALFEIPHRRFEPARLHNGLTLALDGVQNPGNMGTIIRLADWFGIRNILCSADSADCFSPKVVQATMGAIARVAVHYGDLVEMIAAVGGPVYGTFLEGENIYRAGLSKEGVVVLGSEGHGISPAVEGLVTRRLVIPPWPADSRTAESFNGVSGALGSSGPESLNVAVAAGIVCSEFRRRK